MDLNLMIYHTSENFVCSIGVLGRNRFSLNQNIEQVENDEHRKNFTDSRVFKQKYCNSSLFEFYQEHRRKGCYELSFSGFLLSQAHTNTYFYTYARA